MNKFNIDPLFNKHAALGEMLIKEQGINKAIESLIESIEDSIGTVDAKMHCELVHLKHKLMELI
jgi:hypothetical protein